MIHMIHDPDDDAHTLRLRLVTSRERCREWTLSRPERHTHVTGVEQLRGVKNAPVCVLPRQIPIINGTHPSTLSTPTTDHDGTRQPREGALFRLLAWHARTTLSLNNRRRVGGIRKQGSGARRSIKMDTFQFFDDDDRHRELVSLLIGVLLSPVSSLCRPQMPPKRLYTREEGSRERSSSAFEVFLDLEEEESTSHLLGASLPPMRCCSRARSPVPSRPVPWEQGRERSAHLPAAAGAPRTCRPTPTNNRHSDDRRH